MKSIQRRLSLGLVSVLLIAGLVVGQVSLWLFENGLQRYLESGLQNDSENLLIAGMHLGGSGFAHIVPTSHGYRIQYSAP